VATTTKPKVFRVSQPVIHDNAAHAWIAIEILSGLACFTTKDSLVTDQRAGDTTQLI